MRLSSPIHRLKREAKARARQLAVPLHTALDGIAVEEGFSSWSLLVARNAIESTAERLYSRLTPGDLVLIGARPGQGKTMLALECAAIAASRDQPCLIFSLEYTDAQIRQRLDSVGMPKDIQMRLHIDCSETICTAQIVASLAKTRPNAVVVIDYLQLLDQRRSNPPLSEQVAELQAAAQEYGATMLFIAQIDRSFETASRRWPTLSDLRLPNPVDLGLFNQTWFIVGNEVRVGSKHAA